MLLFGSIIDQYDLGVLDRDDTELGRWVYMAFQGDDGIITRILCGYNPCHSGSELQGQATSNSEVVFLTKEKNYTCPRD